MGPLAEGIEVGDRLEDVAQTSLELGPLVGRTILDHALELLDPIAEVADQAVEGLVLCHVDHSIRFEVSALRQDLAGAEQRIGEILPVLGRGDGRQRAVSPGIACNLNQGGVQALPTR